MRHVDRTLRWISLFSLLVALPGWCKGSPKSETAVKVCVAGISNLTATSLFEERMAARLTKSLQQNKLGAVAMDSATTDSRELRPTVANGNEMKRQECDFVLLTQVRNDNTNVTNPSVPAIRIGGRVPSTDASDPMGGQSGPVYREQLEVDYALFRAGKFNAETNGSMLERPSGNVSDSLVQAMDRVANRVAHDLKKK